MKVALISDIHSNLEALQATLEAISTQEVDYIVCLGDIVGYNANPTECIELLRQRNVTCVAGNHDRAVTGQITTKGFDYTAKRAVAWTRNCLSNEAVEYLAELPVELSIPNELVAVHGALHPKTGRETVRLDSDARRRQSFEALLTHHSKARVCAFGHTHQLGIFELHNGVVQMLTGDQVSLRNDAWYLVNPGSVGQPRTADRRSTYLILNSFQKKITAHYVDYADAIPFAKTRNAGLLPFWIHLPQPIRKSLRFLPTPIRSAIKWAIELLRL
ncbi:metallophosphoesterase family protein [Microvirga vignae]|uniref:metallophosphoesterase family protein n=1 Tax=Microvirga vignae TaxID=1225564 RepID=UPI000A04E51F|nr:metallophosphoesterase family protein [Microvirga vignae]